MDLWDYYFGVLASWLLHPGYLREGTKVPSLEEISDLVDKMIEIRESKKCRQ